MTDTREPLYIDDDGNPVYSRNVVCMTRTCGNYRVVIPLPDNGQSVYCGGTGAHPLITIQGEFGPEVVEDRNITPDPDNPVPDVLPPDPDPLPAPEDDVMGDAPESEVA